MTTSREVGSFLEQIVATPTVTVAVVAGVASLIGASIGAAVSLHTSARNIKIDNITKERAKWRENVRSKALEVHKAAVSMDAKRLQELYLEFSLILNTRDLEDRSILDLIRQLKRSPLEPDLIQLAERIALLLKHDWGRAKWEASPWWHCLWYRRRMTYKEFNDKFPYSTVVAIPASSHISISAE